ncbi:MAG TPA: nitroreductase family protein [Acidobacteriaceae bacterium]|nr:nitroreductase family protein [Acidobacteriaceae bacterium]
MTNTTAEAIETLKQADPIPGVHETILQRWSPRAFSDRPVSASDLKKLFEAARWAASSFNEQPWRFIVGRKGDPTYGRIFESLATFNQAWANSAPVLMLSVGKKTFTQNGNPNHYALHDTGAATANIALQATILGFHTHSMGGFDRDKIRKTFEIPEDYEIGAVTAIGYLGNVDALPDSLKAAETSVRKRKTLSEFVLSEWNKAARLE